MNATKYPVQAIEKHLKHNKIATLEQLGSAMGNPARTTIFRKLAQLEYLSSYSHRGKYYTLKTIARFNSRGLWHCRDAWFSRFGNLLDTACAIVHNSEAGYTAAELKDVLHVKTKHALTQLKRSGRIDREQFDSVYVYLSAEEKRAAQQRKARKARLKGGLAPLFVANSDMATEEAKAAFILFFSMLNEKQRRLYAGLESLKLGHGGDAYIASILGMDPHTVARGRQKLINGDINPESVRKKGGGRLPQEKKRLKS